MLHVANGIADHFNSSFLCRAEYRVQSRVKVCWSTPTSLKNVRAPGAEPLQFKASKTRERQRRQLLLVS